MFVTFEGMEGSGKSTALAGVAKRLEAMGMDVVCTREPGGSELGRTVRTLLLNAKRSMVCRFWQASIRQPQAGLSRT